MRCKPDVVIFDRESRKKCSIHALRVRQDLKFIYSESLLLDKNWPETLGGCLFLHVDGPPLSKEDSQFPLLLVDASWKRAKAIGAMVELQNLPKRSLDAFTTSYPRTSKFYPMPANGLASVEALYAAYLIQGREDIHLIDHYHWREEFLRANQSVIEEWREIWKDNISR